MTEYLVDATRGTAVTRNVHAVGGVLSEQNPDGTWEWLLRDGLGSVRSVTDAAGAVLETVDYSPYGVANAALTRTAYGFTGEMIDTNGRVYLRARYYHPTLGIFPTLDPFEGAPERPLSLHGYSWVEGNVVNATDPTGWCAASVIGVNEDVVSPAPIPDALHSALETALSLVQGVLLDVGFGVHLMTNPNMTKGSISDWRAWNPRQVNTAFTATIQNALMYNRIAIERLEQQTKSPFTLVRQIAIRRLEQQIKNPFLLFRQINGPIELRLHNVENLQIPSGDLCQSIDQNMIEGGNTTLYGLICVPVNRGMGTSVTLADGTSTVAGTWGQLQRYLREGATIDGHVVPTVIHMGNKGFTGGSIKSTELTFSGNFLLQHEYGHVVQENWSLAQGTLSSVYVTNSIKKFPHDPSSGKFTLVPGNPDIGSRSALTPDEYLADAIANLRSGTFDLLDPLQADRRNIVWDLIAELIRQKKFGF